MARAREPEPRIGGAMAPGVLESAGRARALAENRLLEAMREAGASERGKMQARAQIRTAQIGAGSRQAVAAMQAREADRRAAERVRGEQLDREFMEGQTRLTHHLLSEREQAERDAETLRREEDWEKFGELHRRHEGNKTAIAMIESAGARRIERGALKAALREVDSLEKVQKLYNVESRRVKELTEEKEMLSELSREIEDRIALNPYLTFDEEMGGNIQDFFDEDLKELGVERARASTLLLAPERRATLAREIAAGRIKADDIRKIYVALKKRQVWAKEQVNELLDDKDKLMEPGRIIWPFEELFRRKKELDTSSWYYREKPTKPTEKGILLRKRQERLANLSKMIDSFENLQSSEADMADGSGKVKDFVGKLIRGLSAPITFDYKSIMEAKMPNLEGVREDLLNLLEEERFDWDELIERAPTREAKEALQRARIIEGQKIEEEVGEPEEPLKSPSPLWRGIPINLLKGRRGE